MQDFRPSYAHYTDSGKRLRYLELEIGGEVRILGINTLFRNLKQLGQPIGPFHILIITTGLRREEDAIQDRSSLIL